MAIISSNNNYISKQWSLVLLCFFESLCECRSNIIVVVIIHQYCRLPGTGTVRKVYRYSNVVEV